MSITVRGVCSGGNDGGTSTNKTQTLTFPAGCQVGDIIIVVAQSNTGTLTCSTPSGYNLASGPDTSGSANQRTYVFWKVLTSTDISTGTISTVWSANGSINLSTGIVYSGGTSIGTPSVVVNPASAVSINMGSVTTGESSATVLQLVCTRNSGGVTGTPTVPTGWTDELFTANGGTSIRCACMALDQSEGTAGTYGGETINISDNCQITGYTIEIVPPAASSGWSIYTGLSWRTATVTVL